MSAFKARVLADLDYIDKHIVGNLILPGVFGLELNAQAQNGDTADAFFWYAEDEAQVVLVVQDDETLEQAAARAVALSAAFDADSRYREYGTRSAIATRQLNRFNPSIDGYEVNLAFGNQDWLIFYVDPKEKAA